MNHVHPHLPRLPHMNLTGALHLVVAIEALIIAVFAVIVFTVWRRSRRLRDTAETTPSTTDQQGATDEA